MAKKPTSKSKDGKRKPKPKPHPQPYPVAMGDDYGNVLRFLFAGVTDAGWRNDIATGDEAKIRAALASIGIAFSHAGDLDDLVEACQDIHGLTGAWVLFDNLRTALLGSGAGGAL